MHIFKQGSFILYFAASLASASPVPEVDEVMNFIDSCSIQNFDVPYLTAECRTKKGGSKSSTLNLDGCIGNTNGVLVHPGGKFMESCNDVSASGTELHASCKDYQGHQISNSVNVGLWVNNNDGSLHC